MGCFESFIDSEMGKDGAQEVHEICSPEIASKRNGLKTAQNDLEKFFLDLTSSVSQDRGLHV